MSVLPFITLTTDFGLSDPYVGAMKGAILTIAPEVTLVDITHSVEPQNTVSASYLLAAACPYFPDGTIHLAVVDPGVGTNRRPIAVQTPRATFVGPDNGIFASVLQDGNAVDVDGRITNAIAVELADASYWRRQVSHTFHGRDIFGPVAAHLAHGLPIDQLGPRIPSVQAVMHPELRAVDGAIHGQIVHIDRFGNAISNVLAAEVSAASVIEIAGRRIRGVSRTYQDAELVALEGSTGLIEIAVRNGSATETLGLNVGQLVVVRSPS